jgi:hypothetical protein
VNTATTTQQDARLELVEEHLRAENAHDLDAIVATFGRQPTFVLNGLTLNGHEGIRNLYGSFGFGGQGGFSALAGETTARHLSDEAIVLELTLRGKHTAEWQGIPATGREFAIPACAIFTFDGEGKLAGERVYFDGALLLQQLGVLP